MRQSFIGFDYKDLAPVVNIAPAGTVGNIQNYNGDTGEWAPDYRLTPLVICPAVRVIDPDGRSTADVTAKLTDVEWYEVEAGTETLITGSMTHPQEPTESKYTIGTAANGWRLQLNANINAGETLSLRMKAKYLDTRKNAVLTIVRDFAVKCRNETLTMPELSVDFPEVSTWDPIYHSDSAKVTIKAQLLLPSGPVAAAKRLFEWEMLRDDGSWSAIGSSILDNEADVSADGSELTLDRSLMGARIDLRVRARYDPAGNPAGVTLDERSPEKRITCIRELCEYDYENTSPRAVSPDMSTVRLSCRIHGAKGDLPTPERELEFIWYGASNPTAPSYTEITRGKDVDVSTGILGSEGGMTAVDVRDRGPLKYLRLSTGEYLTVGGKLLMARVGKP